MIDPASSVLSRATALVDDRSLSAVRRWKDTHPGGLAVGYLPIYVPRPLIEAMGCLPVALFGGGDSIDIIRGDSYFQSYICHIPRSTVELGLRGDLDALDAVLFPSICDVIRNLGGMWRMLFPQKLSLYVDLPQTFDPHIGGKFYVHEMQRIAHELVARGAKALDAAALWEAIAHENDRRAAISALDDLRRREPWRVRASEAYLIVRCGAGLPALEHAALVREFLSKVALRDARPIDNVRVVLVGSFCEQPPFDLVRALERSGCEIVDDDFQLGLRMIDGDIAGEGDPLVALSNAYLEKGRDTASRYIGDLVKGAGLLARVRASRADGVIFAAASFCDPALLDQPMLEQALTRAGVPHTSFKFAENMGQFQVVREQAGAFSDAVKLWGAAS